MNKDDKKKLSAYAERVARLLTDKKEIDKEINEVLAEAAEKLQLQKGNIRKAAKELNLDAAERADKRAAEEEMEQIRHALGLLADTPLGQAAQEKVAEFAH